jgi:ribosomal protein S27AE
MAKRAQPEQFSLGIVITDPDKARQQDARKNRKCLSCSNSFMSDGPGNRICGRCKECVAWSTPADFSVSTAAF